MPYAKYLNWGWEERAVESLLVHSHDGGFVLTNSSTTGVERGKAREGGGEETDSLESPDPVPQEVRFSLHRMDKRQHLMLTETWTQVNPNPELSENTAQGGETNTWG